MKLRLEVVLAIGLFLLLMIPLSIYSTVLEDTNITQNNTTLLNVPDVRQPTNSSCGPTALQAVLDYYGTDKPVDVLINMTNSSENGTTPDNIAQAARDLGFNAEIKENMTPQDLQQNINQGTPTIIVCQAWRDGNTTNQSWKDDQDDGHYMVVIGIDDKNVYFEDPAILGSRGFIPLQEFLERWHDQYENQTGNNTTVNHLGIMITGKQPVSRLPFIEIN
ncbi:MAG: C39 family peptidase [Methanobacterium sp.]|nr:C39 family peptidase [Methanobacterium sp.]